MLVRHLLEWDATRFILCRSTCEDKCTRCHQISTHPVQCYVCIWLFFVCLFFVSRHISPDVCKDATEQCFCSSVFILHPIKPLACPILFCPALSLFPFHWCPSFPPLSLCWSILLIFVSLAGQGVTWAEERGRGDGGMSNSVSCCYCQNIALAFFVFSAYLVQNSWLFQ